MLGKQCSVSGVSARQGLPVCQQLLAKTMLANGKAVVAKESLNASR